MRPREPNAEECKDILEDIRRYYSRTEQINTLKAGGVDVFNNDALLVLAAWLRHKAYHGTMNRKKDER